jgi:hypothetical protein
MLKHTEYEAGWAPELVWKFLTRENSLSHTGIQILDYPVDNLVQSSNIC